MRSLIRGFALASVCSISNTMTGPMGDDVIGDLHGSGSGGISPAFANKDLAIDDRDLADAGSAVAQMRQDGGTTFIGDGGTKVIEPDGGSSFIGDDGSNGIDRGTAQLDHGGGVSDGRDYGDEDPPELELA